MKKVILLVALSVFLCSATGYTAGSEGDANKDMGKAFGAAARGRATAEDEGAPALAVTRFLKADAQERQAYAQDKQAYVKYKQAEKEYTRADAPAQAKEVYEQAKAKWREARFEVWKKANDERSQALLQAREEGVEREAEAAARAAADE